MEPAPAEQSKPVPSTPALRAEPLLAVARAFLDWLSRPRVRLAVIGAILLTIGGLFMTSSVWTLPLVVAGALMVSIAWIGRRLDGRFAVEWGEAGTSLEFRAQIKAPRLSPAALTGTAPAPTPAGSEPVLEGDAHTVEIDVGELQALIAAVQAPAPADFRVARSTAD